MISLIVGILDYGMNLYNVRPSIKFGQSLRLFRFAVGSDSCEEDVPAGDDRRRPAEAGEGRGPFDIGSFRPFVDSEIYESPCFFAMACGIKRGK